MGYWLLKTEPDMYSFADLMRDKKAVWDGVSYSPALRKIRAMKKDDPPSMYHPGDDTTMVGVAESTSHPCADPHRPDPQRPVVDLRPKKTPDQRSAPAEMWEALTDLSRSPAEMAQPFNYTDVRKRRLIRKNNC